MRTSAASSQITATAVTTCDGSSGRNRAATISSPGIPASRTNSRVSTMRAKACGNSRQPKKASATRRATFLPSEGSKVICNDGVAGSSRPASSACNDERARHECDQERHQAEDEQTPGRAQPLRARLPARNNDHVKGARDEDE